MPGKPQFSLQNQIDIIAAAIDTMKNTDIVALSNKIIAPKVPINAAVSISSTVAGTDYTLVNVVSGKGSVEKISHCYIDTTYVGATNITFTITIDGGAPRTFVFSNVTAATNTLRSRMYNTYVISEIMTNLRFNSSILIQAKDSVGSKIMALAVDYSLE